MISFSRAADNEADEEGKAQGQEDYLEEHGAIEDETTHVDKSLGISIFTKKNIPSLGQNLP